MSERKHASSKAAQSSDGERRIPLGRPFQPGQSGNPGGRPKAVKEVQDLARQHTEDAISALADIVLNDEAPPAARASAAQILLDRGWGKATQVVEGNVKHEHAWTEIPAPLRERIAAACGMAPEELREREETGKRVH